MTLSNLIMVLAILIAPFSAVFVQRKLDEMKEKRGRKLWIFRTLMATRGNKLSLDHVQALNSIDLFFEKSGKEKKIIDKWGEYLDHLHCNIKADDKDYGVKMETWTNKADDILAELLAFMGEGLGYDFDKVRLKKGIYTPKKYGDVEIENTIIRRGMIEIILGKKGFPIIPYGEFKKVENE